MKQAERNRKGRARILSHALAEFAANGYAGSSLNLLCAHGGISKGQLYHYYDSKDTLYLACVQQMFDELTDYLRSEIDPASMTVAQYFAVRMQFFRSHPAYRQLFYDILIEPPTHLSEALHACRAAFDALNDDLLRTVLQQERLRPQLSMEQAIQQFRVFVNFLGVYLRESPAKDSEQQSEALLQTMLYGMTERETPPGS